MIRGLVIGKFYPPHRGHKFLIDTALAQGDHLDVLVCSRAGQTIPGELRAHWLREIHPQASVQTIDDPGETTTPNSGPTTRCEILGRAPNIVFTSEDYGEHYARFLGCRHVMVDRDRAQVPVSASAIRSAPLRHWEFLEPCVRAHFAKRVSVVGAESTGTTTLARDLAEHYQTVWVPEYGREYCENMQAAGIDLWTYQWSSKEFTEIARKQQATEDQLAREANRVLICDTDVLATGIWHERYMNANSPEVDAIAESRRHDLYLLTDCDLPFVQHGLRDGESVRQWMTRRFEQVLTERGLPWVKICGLGEQRLAAALCGVDKLLV
ncbi:MAG TPA: AAA family ATPase [Candidatus Sulfotelmatobacter sp.]|nr:AAA family ATPase [Candidatus Sulfotelmatobacter sp.]